jgi:hypothetical protein
MLSELDARDLLLTAWTGNYPADIFVVDDLAAVRGAMD